MNQCAGELAGSSNSQRSPLRLPGIGARLGIGSPCPFSWGTSSMGSATLDASENEPAIGSE